MPSFFEQPVLNSPYERPSRHWELDGNGQPTNVIVASRRGSSLVSPIPKARKSRGSAQAGLFAGGDEATPEQEYNPTETINGIQAALRYPDEARALLMQQARWRQLRSKLEEDVAEPDRSGDAEIARLASAIEASASVPETADDARARLAAAARTVAAEQQTVTDRPTLIRMLRLADDLTIDRLAAVTEVIAEIGRAPTTVLALHDAALLDPLTQLTIERERETANTLTHDGEALKREINEDGFDIEKDELNHLAGVLAETGLLGRFFGGDFRRAKRRASAVLHGYDGHEAAADTLRRLARHKSRASAFRTESPATTLFPKLLWRGAESDWSSLDASVLSLKRAREGLTAFHCDGALDAWLALASPERAEAARIAERLLPVLTDAKSFGLADCPVADLSNVLAREHNRIDALHTALEEVGALPQGRLVRDAAHLAERLATLRAVEADFNRVAAGEGFQWSTGIGTSLEPLARALGQCDQIAALTGPLDFLHILRSADAPVAATDAVIREADSYGVAVTKWQVSSQALTDIAGLTSEATGNASSDWPSLAAALAELSKDEEGARLAADLLRYRDALNEIGCAPFALAALEGAAPAPQLADLYELLVIRSLLTDYLGGDGVELQRLGSLTLDAARREFVRIDKELHDLEAQTIIAKRLRDKGEWGVGSGPRGSWTETALIEHELSLRRPRTPIRDLTLRAGKSLQSLKPVWMMSPTSAAQYIRPGSLEFDLLVVDEASQMRPEFAISAIMRGKQFIVVGDANQLPPTDFFSASTDDDDSDGDDAVKVDTESILDLANHRFRSKRRLKWHYRSQHEGLIQFSNRQFYDRDLVVFPSPTTEDDVLGVKCHYIEKAVYEASINQSEAQAVIEEAFRLMRTYPQYSLGIVTMNAKQTELIRNEFDRLILDAPEVRAYVDEYAGGIDEFFIKNLENVQGDERDIILISTVYGPAKDGTVAQRFGPMNRDVGWRRLNVLVTRAKRSTQLFTSLRPNDIKITENSSRGLVAFQAYLTYAHNGAQYEDGAGGAPDSDFEIFVADALRGAGYEVVHQVGVEGFRIDLGIRHADYPIGFVAGIECDGASYHSGLTVRDRDRIRQTILEGMGWNIYRVWSTDWFADPHRETVKLLARLDTWRDEFSKQYQARSRGSGMQEESPDDDPTPPAEPFGGGAPGTSGSKAELDDSDTSAATSKEPTGRPMRPLDDISWFEVSRGQRYEVWITGGANAMVLAGSVEVLSRASATPQVYGGKLRVARSEYEGWVAATDAYFKNHDIHAAVREVARQARNSADSAQ